MLGNTYDSQVCSIARALEVVGERWSLLIIRDALFAGVTRYSDDLVPPPGHVVDRGEHILRRLIDGERGREALTGPDCLVSSGGRARPG